MVNFKLNEKAAVLTAAALILIMFSCAGKNGKSDSYDFKWDYSIEIQKEGSKSELRSHFLYINGKVLPDVFNTIFTGSDYYRFQTRTEPWGDDGYVKMEKEFSFEISENSLDSSELEQSFYYSAVKKKNTPRNWLYFSRDSLSGWINPAVIFQFIETQNFELIPRYSGLQIKTIN